jgi:chromosome partitioning protein
VANLGAFLALRRKRRVLAIDMDPQGQLAKVLGIDSRKVRRSAIDLLLDTMLGDPVTVALDGSGSDSLAVASRIPRLDVVVAKKSLGLAPAFEREGETDPTGRLLRRLEKAVEIDRYDFVLVDSPPSFGLLTLNILRAVDEVVVPVPLTFLALDGCAELVRSVATVRSRYDRPDLRISMVIPTFYRRTRMAQEVLDTLKRRFPTELAHTVLGFHVRIDEAQARGLSVFEYAPRDRGALSLAALGEELEKRGPVRSEGEP